jgi:hypothetical protein
MMSANISNSIELANIRKQSADTEPSTSSLTISAIPPTSVESETGTTQGISLTANGHDNKDESSGHTRATSHEAPPNRENHNNDSEESIGMPSTKARISKTDYAIILPPWLLFAFSVCVITPSLPLAWYLGPTNQLTLIGLVISIINKECLSRIMPIALAIIEGHWGRSRLQTYDAILFNDFARHGISTKWRILLFAISYISIGLGVSYKQFIGGEVSHKIKANDLASKRAYGLYDPFNTKPALFSNFANTPYLLSNATSDFFEQSATDDTYPQGFEADNRAISYGHNILLLGNDTAAVLDLPRSSYLSAIKNRLKVDESWSIEAKVYGLVTRLNDTVQDLLNDDNFWSNVIDSNVKLGFNGMTSFSTFANRSSLGMVPYIPNNGSTMSCLLGMYGPSSTFWSKYYTDPADPDILAFRNSTLMFTTHRANCSGSWLVTRDSIRLHGGTCEDGVVESAIFSGNYSNQYSLYPLDVLPILIHSLHDFGDARAGSPWKIPAYTIVVAASVETSYGTQVGTEY